MTKLNAELDAAQKASAESIENLHALLDQFLSGDAIKDAHAKAVGSARGYIRQQPLTAVGIAVASGFLLSLALRQR